MRAFFLCAEVYRNFTSYVLTGLFLFSFCPLATAVLPDRNGGWIPNTDGLVLVAGAELNDLRLVNLDGTSAIIFGSTFENSNLTGATFARASINDVNFTNSIVAHANLDDIEPQQLYSTASYKNGNLQGISLVSESDGWDFQNQNLAASNLTGRFSNGDFTGANLSDAFISGDYTNAKFDDATIDDLTIAFDTLVPQQIYETANYRAKDLRRITFRPGGFFVAIPQNLQGINFRDQNLTGSRLVIDAENGDFTRAILKDADLKQGSFVNVDFQDAEIKEAELTSATFDRANMQGLDLVDADLSDSKFVGTNLQSADLTGADFVEADLSRSQLNQTRLVGADFRGAQLTESVLTAAKLQNANFQFAEMDGVVFDNDSQFNQWTVFPDGFDPVEAGLSFVESPVGDFNANNEFDSHDIDLLNRRIYRRDDVPESIVVKGRFILLGDDQIGDGVSALTLDEIRVEDIEGVRVEIGAMADLTISGFRSQDELDLFLARRRKDRGENDEWLEAMFDITGDGSVIESDLTLLLEEKLNVQVGDTNLDGSVDFVDFLSLSKNYRLAGQIVGWAEGDFDGNGIVQFQDFLELSANYGSVGIAATVPEPSSTLLLILSGLFVAGRPRAGQPRQHRIFPK